MNDLVNGIDKEDVKEVAEDAVAKAEEVLSEDAKAEDAKAENVQAHTEVDDSDRGGSRHSSDAPVWPWIVGGAVLLLAALAAIIAVLLRKKKPAGAAGTVVDPVPDTLSFSVGKVHQIGDRSYQQDSFGMTPAEMLPTQGMLAVVADGMGGLQDGDKVSQLVVSTMLNGFVSSTGHPQALLLSLAAKANAQVNRMLGGNVGRSGSTLVAGVVRDGQFYYLSIGDSRICLYRNGQLIQLNREHIHRNDLIVRALNGGGTLQAAFADPKAGGLTSYIGMGELKYVDVPAQPVKILPGDKFILMTDGVYNALTEAEMLSALAAQPEFAAQQIGAMVAAKAFKNQDNYTAVILGF